MTAANQIQPQEAIVEANQQFMSMFPQGSACGVAGLYTADAQLLPANIKMFDFLPVLLQ